MRFLSLVLPLSALFLSSCANQGVVVRKAAYPLPFYHSVGVDGSYKFALRDNAGAVRSQLVTPEVFEKYAEGDYFNDLQPGAARNEQTSAGKATAAVMPAASGARQAATVRNPTNGVRVAADVRGSNLSARALPVSSSSLTRVAASAPKVSSPSTLGPKGPSTVSSRAVAVKLRKPSAVNRVAARPRTLPPKTVSVAKVQTVSGAPSALAAATPNKSAVAASVQKPKPANPAVSRTRTASKQIASSTRKVSPRAAANPRSKKAASKTSVASKTKTTSPLTSNLRVSNKPVARTTKKSSSQSIASKTAAKKAARPLATSKSLKTKKSTKRTALKTRKSKTVSAAPSVPTRPVAQIAFVSVVRVR